MAENVKNAEEMSQEELKAGIANLEAELGYKNSISHIIRLSQCRGADEAERIRKEYMSKLEEYNYFKDIAQVGSSLNTRVLYSNSKTKMAIGKIADREGRSIRDIYKELNIEDDQILSAQVAILYEVLGDNLDRSLNVILISLDVNFRLLRCFIWCSYTCKFFNFT